ncbi:MAG TPA: ABC transporter permease [Chryseosolibacter sp.]|nr:ABC transporter permease [Chryseosolibacter sp.]
MFRNYLNIAFRSLLKNGVFSFINIAGLSIGIASAIMILLWVHDEITYNRYFSNYTNLHQVKINNRTDDGIMTNSLVPFPLRDELLTVSRIRRTAMTMNQSALLSVGQTRIRKTGIDAGESFLEMFDFRMIHGQPETALDDPMSIVLTESTARALFGTDDVIGKMVSVKIEVTEELQVTGVIADPPANVSIAPAFILPFAQLEKHAPWMVFARGNWTNNSFVLYVELHSGADKEEVDRAIHDLIKVKSNQASDAEIFLHPMSRWRLHNNFENGKEAGGLIDYVMMFSCIAGFILIMACINFMNLTTARSQHRAREVGVRKSIGSTRRDLIFQFIGESMLISAVALFIALILVELTLPAYNRVVGKALSLNYWAPGLWGAALLLVLITGVIAGSYPAFYLSGFKPASILKGNIRAGAQAVSARQVLVTVQNVFSILLIIGTAIVYLQIQHLRSREPGYNQENLMLIWSNADIEKNYHALKEELLSTQAAVSVTKSNAPVTRIFASSRITWPAMPEGQRLEATNVATEYDFTKTLGISMLAGRDFSPEYKSDTAAIILNQAAVDVMGLKDPIGEKITMWGQSWTVIGVMDNVLMGSPSHNISPMVMTMDPAWSTTITVRVRQSTELGPVIKQIEGVFKKYNPEYPFEYRFADDEFDLKFSSIEMVSNLAGSFAVLAMIITALGLFGMAAFTTEQRTKEIGIRKVLGATVGSVLLLLTKDFSKLVIIAFLITTPLAWWAGETFLRQYELRIEMPVWIFPLAGITSLVITILIVSTQAVRAAGRNPVDSLRSE